MPAQSLTEARIARRTLLRALAISGASTWISTACGYFPAEDGDAFAPWNFPDGEGRTSHRMAQAGILAASPHNTQPWLFELSEQEVQLRADEGRGLGTIDSRQRELYVGLGCAVENMRLCAADAQRTCELILLPDRSDPSLVARLVLTGAGAERDPLFALIARRHTNRGRYADVDPPAKLEAALRAHASDQLIVSWLGRPNERRRMRDETIAATRAIIDDEAMSQDSYRWYRHSQTEIARHRDGVTLDATGRGALTRGLGKMLDKPNRAKTDAYWLDATKNEQTTGSAFVILSSRNTDDERVAQLRVGMAYQRMHLWATANGLAMQPLNQLTERRDREESEGLPPRFAHALDELTANAEARAQMIFRVGYPWDPALKSPRRPLAWVEV